MANQKRSRTLRSLSLKSSVVALVAAAAVSSPSEVAAQGVPPPPYNVRIRAVMLADDDGSNAATLDGAFVAARVAEANSIWGPSGLHFEFNPIDDMEYLDSTLLNNDCTIIDEGLSGICDRQPNAEERDRIALDPEHDGKITVYFRYGGSTMTCPSFLQCTVDAAGGGFSGIAGHFVVMRGFAGSDNGLAHELGHYFWNYHTHRKSPANLAGAQQAVRDYVADGAAKADGDDAFDGDRGTVNDTNPDPGTGFWASVKGDHCAASPGGDTYTLPVTFPDNTTQNYLLQPDRSNIMSYFYGCPGFTFTSSPGQRARAISAVTTKNRKQLIGLTPNYVEFSTQFADSWPTGSTTIMPFTLHRRAHLLVYGALEARIERIDDDGKGTATVYSDPWTSGWTSFVPFELAGAPHFLAYKAGTGSVVIYKVTADEDGVVSLTNKWSSVWSTGWTSFAPFVHDGQPHYAAYKSGTGSIAIDRIRPNALGVDTIDSATWQTGLTTLMPFELNGEPRFLAYGSGTGAVRMDRITLGGELDSEWSSTWTTGWTSFAPFDRGPQPRYVAYKSATGQVAVDAVKSNGLGVTGLSSQGSWDEDWKVFPVRMIGNWYTLSYNSGTGEAVFDLIIQ